MSITNGMQMETPTTLFYTTHVTKKYENDRVLKFSRMLIYIFSILKSRF